LAGTAAGTAEAGEGSGSFFHGANGAISQCGKSVAQSNSFFVHGGTIAQGMRAKHREIDGWDIWRIVPVFDKLEVLRSMAGNR
jgi:hypothetical protein